MDKADRVSRQRAIVLLMLAVLLILSAILGTSATITPSRIGGWAVLALLVGANLAPLHARLWRDGLGSVAEVTASHRVARLIAGFWVLMFAMLVLGIAGDSWNLDGFSGFHMVMTAGLVTALTVLCSSRTVLAS